MSFLGNEVRGKVTEAHDPPLYGIESDRSDRGSESFVKNFKPFRLGTINLRKGRGELILQAIDIPGKQVMDVRYVMLTRKK